MNTPSLSSGSVKATVFALLTFAIGAVAQTPSIFPLLPPSVSTIGANGDVNPYGVLFVPKTISAGSGLQPGDILVSNFNNNANLQGLGTTIMRVNSAGVVSTFYTAPSQSKAGLSAALGVLSNGAVLIGNLPTLDGTSATAGAGSLSVLDRFGDYLGTLGNSTTVNGPWGMAVYDLGSNGTGVAHVFLSNVLTGTVSRIDIGYTPGNLSASDLVIASGLNHRPDPAALELGPSGLAYNAQTDTLYVASSADNAIYEIQTAVATNATVGASLLFSDATHLHGPLDLAILPDAHFLVANSDGSNADPNQPSELVEYTLAGQFLAQYSVDTNNGGAFGLAVNNLGWGTIRLAAVDDNSNSLKIWTTVIP